MKQFNYLLLALTTSVALNAQTTWNTTLNAGTTLKFGTSSNNVLDFWTNNIKRMTLGTNGTLKISALASTKRALIYVDETGTLRRAPDGGPGNIDGPCVTNSMPWYMGGNINPSDNTIGTCTNQDFILKSNDVKAIYIKPNGFVGIGLNNTAPLAMLDISDGIINPNFGAVNHLKITGDQYGTIESNTGIFLNYRTNDYFAINDGSLSNGNLVEKLSIQGVNMNISTNVNVAKKVRCSSTTLTDPAFEAYNTTTTKTNFSVLNNGKTVIGSQTGMTNAALLNLNLNSSTTGSTADNALDIFDQGTNKINFRVKASGYVYAREVKVTTTNFPDYVFALNYKLMPLPEVENYYKTNKHLPEVPSESDVAAAGGIELGEMNKLLLKKIEELTIYLVEQNKLVATHEKIILQLKEQLKLQENK